MAIVRAKRNPNSMASLYGDTGTGAWTDTLDDFFIQKPDGTYLDRQGNPVDFNSLVEASYNNADGIQGGGRIYDDPSTFTRAEAPVWYDEFLRNTPLFGGREFADVDEFFTNPEMQALNSSVQEQWLDKYRPDRGSWTKDLNPATMLMLAALGGGAFSSLSGGAGAAGGGSGSGLNFLAANDAITGGIPAALGGAPAALPAGLSGLDPFLLKDPLLGLTGATSAAAGAPGLVNLANSLTTVPTDLTPSGGFPSVPGGTSSGAASPASSSLQKLLNGTAGVSDIASLLGTLGATAAGAYSANQQNNSLEDLAKQYMEFGAPSRARYEGSFAPGFSMLNEPGYKDALDSTSNSLLSRLSATSGNPFGNPSGLIEANKQINASLALPALQNYRNQNAATSGIASFNSAAPAAATAAIGSQGNALTNIFGGVSDILNPKPASLTLDDLRRMFGNSSNGGLP